MDILPPPLLLLVQTLYLRLALKCLVSPQLERRLTWIRLFRAVIPTDSRVDIFNENEEFRKNIFSRCTTLLFRTITLANWDRVISECMKTLEALLMYTKESQANIHRQCFNDFVQECVNSFISNIQDFRQLSIPFLKGVEVILRANPNRAYLQIGEKLLEYIQSWTEAEPIMSSSIWNAG